MTPALRPSAGWVALVTTALTVGLGWWADATGLRDGARHGLGGAPVDAVVAPDGGRILVAAADDHAVWVLDASSGRRLVRQALDGAPLRLVPMRGSGRPVVLFDAATEVCAVHPFRERTLASCFEPGESDVTDAHDPTPVVVGAVEDGDGALVVAVARLTRRAPTVKLRRFVAGPGDRRWLARGESPWISVPRGIAGAGLWPMTLEPTSDRLLLIVPGGGAMLEFGRSLALDAQVPLGPHPRDVVAGAVADEVYVADADLGELWKVKLASGEVVARVKVGPGAQSIAVDPRRNLVWVAARSSGELVGLRADTLVPVARLPVRGGTGAVTVDSERKRLVATNFRHGTVATWSLAELDRVLADPAEGLWAGRPSWEASGS